MSRRCVSEGTASDAETESDAADPGEMCEMQNLLDTNEHSVSDGLWPIYDQCIIIALAQFACAPLIFVVSCRGNDHAAGLIPPSDAVLLREPAILARREADCLARATAKGQVAALYRRAISLERSLRDALPYIGWTRMSIRHAGSSRSGSGCLGSCECL